MLYIDEKKIIISKELVNNQLFAEFPDEEIPKTIGEILKKYILDSETITQAVGRSNAEQFKFDVQFEYVQMREKYKTLAKDAEDIAWLSIKLGIIGLPFSITYNSTAVCGKKYIPSQMPYSNVYNGEKYISVYTFEFSHMNLTSINEIYKKGIHEGAISGDAFSLFHRKNGDETDVLEQLFKDELENNPINLMQKKDCI